MFHKIKIGHQTDEPFSVSIIYALVDKCGIKPKSIKKINLDKKDGNKVRLALYQPDIPQNMGTLLRLGACLNVPIDVIGPTGFDMSDRALKRSAMDYISKVDLTRHLSFAQFLDSNQRNQGRLILTTTKTDQVYTDFQFKKSDILLLGRESAGVPEDVAERADEKITIPMQNDMRSLNIAVAGAMILGEAVRQTTGFKATGFKKS